MTGRITAASEAVQALGTTSFDPPGPITVITAGLFAAGLYLLAWSIAGHAITIAHEGGHALTAILRGRSVLRVELHADRTGATTSSVGSLLTTFMGYLGPSIFGILGAATLANGRADAVLWVSVVLLALLLVSVRNLFGWISVLGTGATLTLAALGLAPAFHMFVACVWVWFLLLGGLASTLEHGNKARDRIKLYQRTWIPKTIWSGLHLLGAVAALLISAGLLIGALGPN